MLRKEGFEDNERIHSPPIYYHTKMSIALPYFESQEKWTPHEAKQNTHLRTMISSLPDNGTWINWSYNLQDIQHHKQTNTIRQDLSLTKMGIWSFLYAEKIKAFTFDRHIKDLAALCPWTVSLVKAFIFMDHNNSLVKPFW